MSRIERLSRIGTIINVIESDDRTPITYEISIDGTSDSNINATALDYGTNFVYNQGDKVSIIMPDPGSGQSYLIMGLVPNVNQGRKGTDAKSGTVPFFRKLRRGVKRIGDSETYVSIDEKGQYKVSSGKYGSNLSRDKRSGVYYYDVYEAMSRNTSASKTYSRPVRRSRISTDRGSVAENADTKFHIASKRVGLFEGQSKPAKISGILGSKRNVELSEYRFVSNEFSESYMFSGFEDEILKINEQLPIKQRTFDSSRFRRSDSSLLLAENELTETIYGNVVDINKNKLDINYSPIYLGSPPTESDMIIDAKLKSRRGIGFLFQLSTNSTHSESQTYTSDKGFVMNMDKEGAFTLHVPKTSDTGNILYPLSADFAMSQNPNRIETEPLNQSGEEGVPVTLRAQDGKIIFPAADENTGEVISDTPGVRQTGVSYLNRHNYFGSNIGTSIVNINHTRYHNMYAAAESLIANTIQHILIPTKYTTDYWLGPGGLTKTDPGENSLALHLSLADETSNLNVFEIPFPEGVERTEDFQTEEISEFPIYGGIVVVDPANPAMYNGGRIIVAGSQRNGAHYSNNFKVEDGNVSRDTQTIAGGLEQELPKTGGKSANIDFEGSIDVSVGADNQDRKSIVLDTAGGMVAWFGKDINDRSVIMQTDGDMLINVGGSYSGSDPETIASRGFNEGRFDLRVNVTDKGFTTSTFEPVTDADGNPVDLDIEGGDGNPLYASDYIISIGKHGMVIAGMNPTANMIIRNDGNMLIESASGDLTLKGNAVRIVDGAKKPRSAGESKVSGNASVSD